MNVQIASVGRGVGGRGHSGLGVIRLGSAEKTALGVGFNSRPGLKRTQTKVGLNGGLPTDTIKP